jgi:hypothetical protein
MLRGKSKRFGSPPRACFSISGPPGTRVRAFWLPCRMPRPQHRQRCDQ